MGRGTSRTVGGASLLYGAPTRRQSSVDLVVKVDRLVRANEMERAHAALVSAARGGSSTMEELEGAATRIAVTQVLETYEGVPSSILGRFYECREDEEAFLVETHAKYLVVCAVGDIEPPEDPRLHLYRWDETPAELRVSPLCHTLLPSGRTPAQYLHELPGSHKEVLGHLLGDEEAEGSKLGDLIGDELTKFLIEGDGDGFSGIGARMMRAQKVLGRRTPAAPLSAPEQSLLIMSLREGLHPLPGTWIELREQLAEGTAVDKIGRGIAAKTSGLALSEKATSEDWRKIAQCCLLDYDERADERLRQTVREIRRRPVR